MDGDENFFYLHAALLRTVCAMAFAKWKEAKSREIIIIKIMLTMQAPGF